MLLWRRWHRWKMKWANKNWKRKITDSFKSGRRGARSCETWLWESITWLETVKSGNVFKVAWNNTPSIMEQLYVFARDLLLLQVNDFGIDDCFRMGKKQIGPATSKSADASAASSNTLNLRNTRPIMIKFSSVHIQKYFFWWLQGEQGQTICPPQYISMMTSHHVDEKRSRPLVAWRAGRKSLTHGSRMNRSTFNP